MCTIRFVFSSYVYQITITVALQNTNHNRGNQPTMQRTVQNQPTNHRTVPNQPTNQRTVPNQPTNQRRGTLHGSGTIVRGPDGSLGIGRPVNNSGPGVKQPPGGDTGTRNHTTVAGVRRNAVITDEFELDSDDDIDFDGIDNEIEIKCSCNLEAKLLTVRKEGPNTGIAEHTHTIKLILKNNLKYYINIKYTLRFYIVS